MDTIYLLGILLGVGVVSLILFFIFRPSRTKRTTDSLYGEGLRLLLEGDTQEAAKKLRAVVRRDTDYVDAYLKLGDIFRQNGQLKQALKVHQGLTVRRNLYPAQKIDIYHSLVKDYQAAGDYKRALETVDKLLDIDKKNLKGLRAKLAIYRRMRRYEDAGEIMKTIQKTTGEEDPASLALYRVNEGLKLQEQGNGHEARIRYRRALKIDPRCCAALFYLGESYDKEGRREDAVEQWKKFGRTCPDLLHLVNGKLEQQLFELGNFQVIEQYYKSLLTKQPDNIEAAAGLASFYEKKGETGAAIETLESAMEKEPESMRARILLAKSYNKQNKTRQVEEQLEALLALLTEQRAVEARDLLQVK